MDLTAIASAVATRFNATAITPPAGYNDPGTAVYELPSAITTTPTAIVFPPDIELSHWAGYHRSANVDFIVRWYIAPLETVRGTKAMYDWASVLLNQLQSQFDLDLTPTVTHAIVTGGRFGKLEYAGIEYFGMEVPVRVHVEEAFTPTT